DDRQGTEWVCTVGELVEVGRYRRGTRPVGGAGLDNSFAHCACRAVQVYRPRLLGQDAHSLGALEQDAGGDRLEEVQRLAIGDLLAVAKDQYHAGGAWLVAELRGGAVSQSVRTEPVRLGRNDGQGREGIVP